MFSRHFHNIPALQSKISSIRKHLPFMTAPGTILYPGSKIYNSKTEQMFVICFSHNHYGTVSVFVIYFHLRNPVCRLRGNGRGTKLIHLVMQQNVTCTFT